MNPTERDQYVCEYISIRVYDYIIKNGIFYPDKSSFDVNLNKCLSKAKIKIKNFQILFTCFGSNEFMNLHILPPNSTSLFDRRRWHELEIKKEEILSYLRNSKIEEIFHKL